MKGNDNIKSYELWGFRIFTAWCVVSLLYIINAYKEDINMYEIKSVNSVNFFIFVILFFSTLMILTSINIFSKKWYSDIVICCIFVPLYFVFMMYEKTDVYLCTVLILFIYIGLTYIFNRFPAQCEKIKISNKQMYMLIILSALFFILYLGTLSLLRYLNMKSPSYDFGIFSQMYYYMKETFMPLVTCERDKLLSHFNVHISPALYIILPIYYIFPTPATILVMQILILASGVIPLYLICKNRKLSNFITACICITYIFYPAMQGGIFYDFHENKLLTPLIFWFIYFMEKEKKIPSVIFAILVLFVKEDAPIYIACICLYYIITYKDKKNKIFSFWIFVFSCIYFLGAVTYLSKIGDGAMTGRFKNFLVNTDDSLLTIFVNIIKNPAYFFSQLMTVDKLEFMLWTIIPLAFIPFLSRKISTYILFLPYLLFHLISNYPYQHSIFFQYTYGSLSLMFFIVVIFFSEVNSGVYIKKSYNKYAIMMVCAALIMSTSAITPKNYYIDEAKNNMEQYNKVREAFKEYIPDDASVEASSYYVVPLSSRKKIYHLGTVRLCDYIVYDLRMQSDQEKIIEYQKEKENLGYEVICEIDGLVRILKSPNAK